MIRDVCVLLVLLGHPVASHQVLEVDDTGLPDSHVQVGRHDHLKEFKERLLLFIKDGALRARWQGDIFRLEEYKNTIIQAFFGHSLKNSR